MLRKVWALLTPRQRRWVAAAQLLSLLMACSTVVGVASIGPFFAVLGEPHAIDRSALLGWLHAAAGTPQHAQFVMWLGAVFIGIVLVANVINLIGMFVLNRLAWWIGDELRSALYAQYLHRPYAFHARRSGAVLVNTVIHETRRLTTDIVQDGLVLVTNAATVLLIVASAVLVNPILALTMLAALGGGYALIFVIVRSRLARWGQVRSQCIAEQTRVGSESFNAIREVLTFGLQAMFITRFERAGRTASRAAVHLYSAGQSPRYIMECVAVLGLVGAALVLSSGDGGTAAAAGARTGAAAGSGLWLGQLTFLGFAAYRLLPSLQQAFSAGVRMSAARPVLDTISADMREARARVVAARGAPSPWPSGLERDIALKGVSFRYEERGWALENASFTIRAGTSVAFVGANGAGKTTACDLIAGLLVPAAGEVHVDGIPLRAENQAAWQGNIAYVSQDVVLLDTSIAANIALGVRPKDVDRERLEDVCRLARLEPLIASLPGGLDYRVGENAVRLSGGQRQRIGIARALYKRASLLILDEATSAIDSATEQELTDMLTALRGGCTTILISHHSRAARTCDAVVEFADGRAFEHTMTSAREVTGSARGTA